jgi:hypothetical protein
MTLVLRRIALLTSIFGLVIGFTWGILLLISHIIPNSESPIAIGTLLQASAGSLCFAYSIVHFGGTTPLPRAAQWCEALGFVFFGIILWILALPHLTHPQLPMSIFIRPIQIGWVVTGYCIVTAQVLRRYRPTGRQIWLIFFGNAVVGSLFLYCIIQLWNE